MKRRLTKEFRKRLIILLSLLLLASTGFAAWFFKQPAELVRKVPVYTSQQKIQVDYQVLLAPNKFFTESFFGMGQVYIIPLTQYIATYFNYSFSGNKPADISGQYQVNATLTGYVLKENNSGGNLEKEKVKVWEKSWPLLAPTPFNSHDRTLGIQQQIPVDIRSYANFAEQVAKDLQYSAEMVELAVSYDVQTSAANAQGKIDAPLKAVMIIPIDGKSFTIEGTLADKNEKSITYDSIEDAPGVKASRVGTSISTAILLVLLLLLLFTTEAAREDPAEKQFRQIIKKYGDRIASGFSWVPAISEENTIVMHSFNDLLKVADEIAQPILYENGDEGIHSFYVVNAHLIYKFSLASPGQEFLFFNINNDKEM